MKAFARILSLAVALLMLMSLFSACGKKSEDADDTASSVLSAADVTFIDRDGESFYRVVRPESTKSGDAEFDGAADIFKAIKSTCGVNPKNISDDQKADCPEILVGNTNRPESAKGLELLLEQTHGYYTEYIICTIGDDIVINAFSDEALKEAVKYFVDNCISTETITGGINYCFSDDSSYSTLELFGKTNLFGIEIVRPIYNVSYLTQHETDALVELVKNKTGYWLNVKNDNVASNNGNKTDGSGTLTQSTPSECEIIIGDANRDGVNTITDNDSYEIRIEENRIYLNGGSPYATALAVTVFTEMLINNSKITADMSVINGDYNQDVAKYSTADYYRPTWLEGFDGNELNRANWKIQLDTLTVQGYQNANGKDQYRGSSVYKNNYVKDGVFYIAGIETDTAYYGGMIDTRGLMEYQYGLLEISTMHPKGIGFWTALWTGTESAPQSLAGITGADLTHARAFGQETDIDECYGEGTYSMGNTFAWPSAYAKQAFGIEDPIHVQNRIYATDDRGFWMDFHTFGFEWIDNTHVRFTCDGNVFADQMFETEGEKNAYSHSAYLRLSMACGSGNHGTPTTDPDEWQNTNKLLVDYVNIYQKEGQHLWVYQGDWVQKN